MTVELDCDWLAYVHMFECLEGWGRVGLGWVG